MIGDALYESDGALIVQVSMEPHTRQRHSDETGQVPDEECKECSGRTAEGGTERGGDLGGTWTGQGLGESIEFEEGVLRDTRNARWCGRGDGDVAIDEECDVRLRTAEGNEGQRPEGG